MFDAYSATNTMKFDISNDTQKHMLWKQYVVSHCDGYSTAPISDYINNPVFQELLLESDYFGNKVHIDLRGGLGFTNEIGKPSKNDSKLVVTIELKKCSTHKMNIHVWGYTNGEYLYMLVNGGLMLKYKTYTIKSQGNALDAWKHSKKNLY